MVRFQTFRCALLSLVALVSITCIALSIYVLPCIENKSALWVLVGIPGVATGGCLSSISRRSFFKSLQSVGAEAAGSFILLPLELILTLFVLAVAPSSVASKTIARAYFTLEILIFITVSIVFLYTTGLILTAILTLRSFDVEVWSRDIDSSPSPFPIRVLLAYVFPCCCGINEGEHEVEEGLDEEAPLGSGEPESGMGRGGRVVCLPGCRCSSRKGGPVLVEGCGTEMVQSGTRGSLVRIPNEFERRASIVVAFDV